METTRFQGGRRKLGRTGRNRAILKDELEMSGELETLLSGKKTKVMSLSLVLLGVDVVMDATLQLIRKDGEPLMEILGVKPVA